MKDRWDPRRIGHVWPMWTSHAAALALGLTGVALGANGLNAKALQGRYSNSEIILGGIVGLLFLGAGVVAHTRQPANKSGLLMMLFGAGWFAEDLLFTSDPVVQVAGNLAAHASSAFGVHLVLAFPAGSLQTRWKRLVTGVAYAVAFGGPLLRMLFTNPTSVQTFDDPVNLLLIWDRPDVSWAIEDAINVLGSAIAVTVIATLARRWMSSSVPRLERIGPLLAAAAITSMIAAAGVLGYRNAYVPYLLTIYKAALCLVPLGFLASALRLRIGTPRSDFVLRDLGGLTTAQAAEQMLRKALADDTLRLLTHNDDSGDATGLAGTISGQGGPHRGQKVTPVDLDGRRLATLHHDPALAEDPNRLAAMVSAAAVTLERERLSAEVRDSRQRILAAAIDEQHRISRDLHDGAQQGLATIKLLAVHALTAIRTGSAQQAQAHLRMCIDVADESIVQLRDLVHAIHPESLKNHGLTGAITALASDVPIPVTLDIPPLPRYDTVTEATVLFAVREAVTNALKHAQPATLSIHASRNGNILTVSIHDDGAGGTPTADGALRSLSDRVNTLNGTITVVSEPGHGTAINLMIPCTPLPEVDNADQPQ